MRLALPYVADVLCWVYCTSTSPISLKNPSFVSFPLFFTSFCSRHPPFALFCSFATCLSVLYSAWSFFCCLSSLSSACFSLCSVFPLLSFLTACLAESRGGVQTSFSPLSIIMNKDDTVRDLFKRISEDEAHEESLEHINCKDYQLYRCTVLP